MNAPLDDALHGAVSLLVLLKIRLHAARQALTCRSAVDIWPDRSGVVHSPAPFGQAPGCGAYGTIGTRLRQSIDNGRIHLCRLQCNLDILHYTFVYAVVHFVSDVGSDQLCCQQ